MADFTLKLDVDPTDKYEKAKKDMVTALSSFGELHPQQKEQLICELFGVEAVVIYNNIKKNYERTSFRGESV